MPKILIDLNTEGTDKLKALATQHGHKLKPFIEYLLKLQTGTLPAPTAKPVQIPKQEDPKEKPEQDQRTETKAEEPEQITPRKRTAIENARKPEQEPTQEPQQETTQGTGTEAPQWKPNKIDGTYKEKAADRIYTDGISYRLNLFGSVYYFQTLAEAEAKRDK